VTVDPELGEALAAIEPHPPSKSRLIRDLALRGAAAAAEERRGREAAKDYLRNVANREIDLDFDAARKAHEGRETEVK